MSLRVQVSVARVQVQAVPPIAVAVKPAGNVSVIVTVPEVAVPPLSATAIVYVAPLWPWTKLPEWLLVMVRSGGGLMLVTSLAVSLAVLVSPPPETVAALVTEAGALPAPFTPTGVAG